jgi:hypothetical protein
VRNVLPARIEATEPATRGAWPEAPSHCRTRSPHVAKLAAASRCAHYKAHLDDLIQPCVPRTSHPAMAPPQAGASRLPHRWSMTGHTGCSPGFCVLRTSHVCTS